MSVAELHREHALYAPRLLKTRRHTESVQHARVERSTTTSQSLTHVNTFIHSYIHTFIHTFIHSFIHSFIHTCTHTYIRTYVCTYVRTYSAEVCSATKGKLHVDLSVTCGLSTPSLQSSSFSCWSRTAPLSCRSLFWMKVWVQQQWPFHTYQLQSLIQLVSFWKFLPLLFLLSLLMCLLRSEGLH